MPARSVGPPSENVEPVRRRERSRRWPRWATTMAVGAALAPVFTLTPFLQYVAWILSSIIHETGHTLFAWFVGCPALPAINLTGHAMTRISPQSTFVCLIVLGFLMLGIIEAWRRKMLFWPLLGLTTAYPLLAFWTPLREACFLLSGHGGELAIAGIFLWQSRTGLFVHDQLDRTAYAVVGWYLLFSNAWLCFGLVWMPSVLAWYRTSMSYQLTNDYLRLAEEQWNVPLAVVVLPMLVVAVSMPLVVLAAANFTRGAER